MELDDTGTSPHHLVEHGIWLERRVIGRDEDASSGHDLVGFILFAGRLVELPKLIQIHALEIIPETFLETGLGSAAVSEGCGGHAVGMYKGIRELYKGKVHWDICGLKKLDRRDGGNFTSVRVVCGEGSAVDEFLQEGDGGSEVIRGREDVTVEVTSQLLLDDAHHPLKEAPPPWSAGGVEDPLQLGLVLGSELLGNGFRENGEAFRHDERLGVIRVHGGRESSTSCEIGEGKFKLFKRQIRDWFQMDGSGDCAREHGDVHRPLGVIEISWGRCFDGVPKREERSHEINPTRVERATSGWI